MKRVYVYIHHQGFDFFLENRELSPEACYCDYCQCSDVLFGCYNEEAALAEALQGLFEQGYDLVPCDDYNEIKEKYCPPELRKWEEELDSGVLWDDPEHMELIAELSELVDMMLAKIDRDDSGGLNHDEWG